MDLTVTVSENVARIIEVKAAEHDIEVSEFAGDLLEEKVNQEFSNGEESSGPHPLLKMAGMFSSGITDTSERMHEILYSEDFDPAEGFSIRK